MLKLEQYVIITLTRIDTESAISRELFFRLQAHVHGIIRSQNLTLFNHFTSEDSLEIHIRPHESRHVLNEIRRFCQDHNVTLQTEEQYSLFLESAFITLLEQRLDGLYSDPEVAQRDLLARAQKPFEPGDRGVRYTIISLDRIIAQGHFNVKG